MCGRCPIPITGSHPYIAIGILIGMAQHAGAVTVPGQRCYLRFRRRARRDSNPSLLTLLCLSRTYRRIHRPGELPVELAGDVALEAAADLPGGLSLGGAPGDVGAGPGAAAHPDQRDGVDGAVQGPVAAAVEPVPDGLA